MMLEFCQVFENLYGAESCTINLHLHCHIAECLRDYGPAHSTWCFSFERYNGVLGGMPNNNRTLQVEKTMMTRFIQQMVSIPTHELQHLLMKETVGSVSDTLTNSEMYIKQLQYTRTTSLRMLFASNDLASPVGRMSQHALQPYEVQCLTKMYETTFSDCNVVHVSCICYRFSRAKLGSKLVSSQMARSDRSSYICANWLGDSLSIDSVSDNWRPGCIKYFFKHNVTIEKDSGEKESFQSLLAYVGWYKSHPEKNFIPSPVTLWWPEYEPLCAASFIPICRIASRCAQAKVYMEFTARPYNSGQTIVIIPLTLVHL